MIQKGHHSVFNYRYNFFNTALEVAFDEENRAIALNSISTRMSNLEGKEFAKEVDSLTKAKKPKQNQDAENFKRFGGK